MKTHNLNFVPFFSLFFLLTHLASSQNDDVQAMTALRKAINPKGWTTPDPCTWPGVSCTNNRVTRIQLGNNGLTGSLPPEINSLTELQVFEVMRNKLSGDVPVLSGLNSLTRLLLNENEFESLPSDFFSGFSSLQTVDVGYNNFSAWRVGDSLRNCTSLVSFAASSAGIVGEIPGFLNTENFPSLTEVELSFNDLESGIPESFSGSGLQRFWVNGNPRLGGGVLVLGNMTMLSDVWLHGNNFTGPLPEFVEWKASGLLNFSFRDNKFTGLVPDSLVNLKGLFAVNLSNNALQGPMPKFPANVQVDMIGTNRFCLDKPGVDCDFRVDVLLALVKDMGYPLRLAENWEGNDPCKGWTGIVCNGKNIVVINLKGMGLSGTISKSFANLTSLQKIILANNLLTGTIPNELTTLSSLTELDVSNNMLYGDVPNFGRQNVILNTNGNPDIGKDKPSSSPGGGPSAPSGSGGKSPSQNVGKKSNTGPIVGGAVGGGLAALVAAVGVIFLCNRSHKRSRRVQSPNTTVVVHPRNSGDQDAVKITVAGSSVNGGSETFGDNCSGHDEMHVIETGSMVISIKVLRNVTNNFSENNILGQGGFGTVYKGELHDGTKIAVKRMESGALTDKGLNEFKSEIAVLTKVRHRHLVSLLGHCLDGNERILVYEYMPQGALSRHLFHWNEEGLRPLEWKRRLSIALDVGRGVEYLHGLAHQSFIHRDLKPSNILLGDDMRAKVADFGLVRLAPEGKASVETRLAGTFGYLAPEYAVTGRVTTKVDVFSFGVVLMELITGRKALDETQPEDSLHLVTWFRRMQVNKDSFHKAIDSTIDLDEETLASVSTVAELAGHCTAREPFQRPEMSHAVNVLSSLSEIWKPVEQDSEDLYADNFDMTLPQALEKWQANDGGSRMDNAPSFLSSGDTTQSSIPTRPTGFADSFASSDGR